MKIESFSFHSISMNNNQPRLLFKIFIFSGIINCIIDWVFKTTDFHDDSDRITNQKGNAVVVSLIWSDRL